jgi:hypothetical protein
LALVGVNLKQDQFGHWLIVRSREDVIWEDEWLVEVWQTVCIVCIVRQQHTGAYRLIGICPLGR